MVLGGIGVHFREAAGKSEIARHRQNEGSGDSQGGLKPATAPRLDRNDAGLHGLSSHQLANPAIDAPDIHIVRQQRLPQPRIQTRLRFNLVETARALLQVDVKLRGVRGIQFAAYVEWSQFVNVGTVHPASLSRPIPARASITFGAAGASRSRMAWRPRLSRDMTVPIGKSRIWAISRQVKPSTTASSSTVRCSLESASSALDTSAASAKEIPAGRSGPGSTPGVSSETKIGVALICRPCA